MKKFIICLVIASLAVFSSVSVMAKNYESPVATTAPDDVGPNNDANRGGDGADGDGGSNTGSEPTSPVTGDYLVFAIAAAMVLGTGSLFAAKKLAKKD